MHTDIKYQKYYRLLKYSLLIVVVFVFLIRPAFAQEQESKDARDARMKWWREARFGMFVHWGLYSALAGTWDGAQVKKSGDEVWIQQRSNLDTETYAKQAIPKFKPTPGFAREWAKLAKQAGCKYLVFTTKHHDGFGLFDSKIGDFNAGHVLQRDLVKEIVEACRAEGLKVGFYHSLIDWQNDQYEYAKTKHLPHPFRGQPYPNGQRDHSKYIDYLHGQVNELISNYGLVDILWWDYSAIDFQGNEAWGATELMKSIRAKQPEIIMNNRLFRIPEAGWASMGTSGYTLKLDPKYGDFVTPEQEVPATGMAGVDWETCMTISSWGYNENDLSRKSDETLIRTLIDVASKGGNYLLNIGPKGDGSVPEESIKAMQAIGSWMKVNSEAIYGTTASPFSKLDWGRCTKREDNGNTVLYFSVFNWPENRKLFIPGLPDKVRKAELLANGEDLKISSDSKGLTINLPNQSIDAIATVVKVIVTGKFRE